MKRIWSWLRSLDAGERIASSVVVICVALVVWLAVGNLWSTIVSSLQPEMTDAGPTHYDLIAQRSMNAAAWWMVMITGVSVVVGTAGLYLIARTLQEAKRSADAAEMAVQTTLKIGKQQVRAYLNIEDAEAKLGSYDLLFTVDADLRNSGQSPAQNVAGTARLRFIEFLTYPDGELNEDTLVVLDTKFTAPAVGAGQTVKLRLTFTVLNMKPSVSQIFDGHLSRAVQIHLVTEYDDVFEDRHSIAAMLGSMASSTDDFRRGMGMRVSSP